MIENSGRINDLPAQVLVVSVSNVQTLCGEGVRLDFNVGARNLIDETGFADIREARHQDGPSVGVN